MFWKWKFFITQPCICLLLAMHKEAPSYSKPLMLQHIPSKGKRQEWYPVEYGEHCQWWTRSNKRFSTSYPRLHFGNTGIFCLTAAMQQKWHKGSKWWQLQEARICSGHIPSEGFLNIATLWASCLISLVWYHFPQVTSWAHFTDAKLKAGWLKLNSHSWGSKKGQHLTNSMGH